MGRVQRPTNDEDSIASPDTINFSTEQRIEFLANLIVNRILDDTADGSPLLQAIESAGI